MGTNINEEVDRLTQDGHRALSSGNIDDACRSFEQAVSLASHIKEGFTERACFFNLGACCVAQGDAKKGLQYLKKAVPPDKDIDGSDNYADLHYNLGLAYDTLNQVKSAIECYAIALEEYQAHNNDEMRAETLTKLAVGCSESGELAEASDYYGQAAIVFQSLGDKTNQVLALNSQAGLLGAVNDIDQCAQVLRMVIELCEELTDTTLQGKIYNDLGLLYNNLKSYKNAAECFEIAIPLVNGSNQEKQLQAVLHQNLGAVYNQTGRYKKALEHHKLAIKLHGELGNRSAEGQTYCNMGFALSQLKDLEKASDKFLKAIQASIDSSDKRSHWQASEGLAAVYFLQDNYKKAVESYKTALTSLSASGDMTQEHNERIVNKLAEAMKFQLAHGKSSIRSGSHRGQNSKKFHHVEEPDKSPRNVGRTRTKQVHHRLIARGIDGGIEMESESGDSSSSNSSSDSSSENEPEQGKENRGRYIDPSRERRRKGKKSNKVNPQLLLSGPYQKLLTKKRDSLDNKDDYEEPVNDEPGPSRLSRTDYSSEMPRAYREAYLASIATASSTPEKTTPMISPKHEPPQATQSRTCVIQ